VIVETWALKGYEKTGKEIIYGMTTYEIDLELKGERDTLDRLFMLVVLGNLVALPSESRGFEFGCKPTEAHLQCFGSLRIRLSQVALSL
jgi:hypothetical protein